MERSNFKTIITYVEEETGEVIKKEDIINYHIINKIKTNVTKRNNHTRIEWTHIVVRDKQLRLEFPD